MIERFARPRARRQRRRGEEFAGIGKGPQVKHGVVAHRDDEAVIGRKGGAIQGAAACQGTTFWPRPASGRG